VPDHAGERYLRLLVEQILAAGGRHVEGPATVDHAGAALAAVGAVDRAVVARLRHDLGLALELRRPAPDAGTLAEVPAPPEDSPEGERAVPSPRAVAVGPNRFDTPEGVLVVESVTFGADGATIIETLETGAWEPDPDPRRRGRRGGPGPTTFGDPMRPVSSRRQRGRHETAGEHRFAGPGPRTNGPGVPPRTRPGGPGREQLRITDDRGHRYQRGPSTTGGGPTGWRWVSDLRPAPGPETAWLDIALGDRVFRLGVSPPGGVARGRAQRRSPGASWLLGALQDAVAQALQAESIPRTDHIADGLDALLALGWLAPFDAVVQQLPLLSAYPDNSADLDPSLGSALAGRDRQAGTRVATLPVATAIDLGSRAARLDVATLSETGLRLSGWFAPWSTDGTDGGLDGTSGWHLTGFDDRHNQYVATVEQHNRVPAGADVVWRLWPALDPAARSLRLRVADLSLEASVELVVE
jgi:hypothetical protein